MAASPDIKLPTEEEIRALPRWAQVAFAARCARRVQPVFTHHWKNAYQERINEVSRAVDLAERAAASPIKADSRYPHTEDHIPRDCPTPSRSAYTAAHYAAAGSADARDALAWYHCYQNTAGDHEGALRSSHGCDAMAAAKIIRAITSAVEAAGQVVPMIVRDYLCLRQLANAGKWDDDTPVPPTVFGPMWPDGLPPGWPTDSGIVPDPPAGGGDLRLVLKVLADGKVPPEEIAGDLFELYKALNEYHLARGGSGLTIDQFRFLIGVPVGAGV